MKTVNLGLVGLGGIGRIHLHNSMRLQNARLVAVADTSEQSRNLAKTNGVQKVYDDYSNLLQDPTIDCAIISVPTFLHAECTIMAAEQGKHVLVEKPLARNVEEGRKIVAKIQRAGVKAMVGYPLRFSEFAQIKNDIDQGHLGEVVTAIATDVWRGPFHQASYSSTPSRVPSWWFDPNLSGGGALLDLGSHMINLLLWYFGDDVTSVKSVLGHRFNMPLEDQAMCFIKFKQGTSALVNVGWCSLEKTIKIDLFGTAKNMSMALSAEKPLFRILQSFGLKPQGRGESAAFFNELSYFVECIRNNSQPLPSANDGLRDLEVISQAYKNRVRSDY